ncbi:MAG: hypothetical protein Q9217_004848 [Psora testacea]
MATPNTEPPPALDPPKSLTRLGSASTSPIARSRASTLQNGTISHKIMAEITSSPLNETDGIARGTVFEKKSLISGEDGSVKEINEKDLPNDTPESFNEVPIELISLIDRFIETLGAKVYNTPPSIDKLSAIFQDFYNKAESLTATHINALSTRQSRGASPSASISSSSAQSRKLRRSSSGDTLGVKGGAGPELQMLTPEEISDRRKARRLLDCKRLAVAEAVEKRVCERVYSRIWRHRSTLDEVRDEKLRSRTAALALVGIGLQDLGVDMKDSQNQSGGDSDIEGWIAKARDGLLRMNDAKHPLGKLQQLVAAQKNIVELLTSLHQGSASADEILPTLIYTLITTPPEGINVISNLHFIQRFRASSKVDGEAAYCLTNLEAAITFLETVDLASLRSDELLEGPSPSKSSSSRPATPKGGEAAAPAPTTSPSFTTITATSRDSPILLADPLQSRSLVTALEPRPTQTPRRISNLFQPPATAIGAAGDAVRNTADQGIKSIGSALDNSFKLLFGRLGEQKVATPSNNTLQPLVVPKTLDDARKLVGPNPAEDDDMLSSANSFAEIHEDRNPRRLRSEDVLLTTIPSSKQPCDRSIDSSASSKPALQEPSYAGNAAVESMRSLGNTLNPLKGFGGMSVMRGFGRNSSSVTPTADQQRSSSPNKAPAAGIKTLPAIQRFMDMDDAQNLKLSEVSELLQDYKRLAEALRTMGAF